MNLLNLNSMTVRITFRNEIFIEGENSPKNPYCTGRIVGCSKQFKERNSIEAPMIYMEASV